MAGQQKCHGQSKIWQRQKSCHRMENAFRQVPKQNRYSRSCFDDCICHTSRPHLIPPPLPLHSLRPPHPGRRTWRPGTMSLWPGRRNGRRSADFLALLFDGFTGASRRPLFPGRPFGHRRAWPFLRDRPVTVIAQEKGHGTKENVKRNFGMVSPEGYRKARRLMKQAEKFHRPVLFFVDTPGAFCGMEAEETGAGGSHRPEPL